MDKIRSSIINLPDFNMGELQKEIAKEVKRRERFGAIWQVCPSSCSLDENSYKLDLKQIKKATFMSFYKLIIVEGIKKKVRTFKNK